jgi:hypothetical protein
VAGVRLAFCEINVLLQVVLGRLDEDVGWARARLVVIGFLGVIFVRRSRAHKRFSLTLHSVAQGVGSFFA